MEKQIKEQKPGFIHSFNPVWFATVLGFGGIALSSVLVAKIFNVFWLSYFAVFLVYFNLALFAFLFSIWGAKAIFHFRALVGELKHPVMAGFHSLMPAATIMISINFSRVGEIFSLWQYQSISVLFWTIGAIFEFVLLTLTIYFLVVNEKMNINFINGGWLVPPVAALLTPVAGIKLLGFISNLSLAGIVLWTNYFFFGTGIFVFLLVAVSLFTKIFFFEKLDPKVFPSLWIILVPFSLMALSLSLFAEETGVFLLQFKDVLGGVANLINPMLIGAGVWLLIFLIVLTYYYLRKIGLPFGASWWAFIFPTSSVSIASLNQAIISEESLFANLGLVIYLFLIIITSVVVFKTIESFMGSKKIGNESSSLTSDRYDSAHELMIIGAGPAGLTASVYASRFGIKNFIIGSLIEGRLAEAHLVGNFPTEEEINGLELVEKMERRVKNFGTEIKLDKVSKVSKEGGVFSVKTMMGQEYYAKSLILAVGAERKRLGANGEEKFIGKGVSYCATCDGKFFTGKTVAVAGGNSATLTTADYLADMVEKVYLIHSEPQLQADKIWQEKVKKNSKIEIILGNKIQELKGGNSLETLILEKDYKGEKELKVDGIFVENGLNPNLEIIEGLGTEKDEQGFIKVNKDGSTNVEGLFAAGDITNGSGKFRQIVTALSQGAIAANGTHLYIKQKK